ncbi:MAG TPA: hypothetical protein VJ856_01685 [Paludibacteraceae bacterium]|nr:hypothetical protein [Paludibacteraceae bacterium]
MEEKSILFLAFSKISPFEAKIKRLMIIETLHISNQCFRNWMMGINEPTAQKKIVINQIMGQSIY